MIRGIFVVWFILASTYTMLLIEQIEHDLSVIAVEQIKIEHQDNVENQSAYVRK